MNNPLGVCPSKGNQGTTRDKEKIFDLSGHRPRWESNPEVLGLIPTEVKRFFLYLVWFPESLYWGKRPVGYSWVQLTL